MAKKQKELKLDGKELTTSLLFLSIALEVFVKDGIIDESQCDACVKSISMYLATSKDVKFKGHKNIKTEIKTETKTKIKKNGKATKNGATKK